MKEKKLIPLGKITKPQGLKGAFRLRAFGIKSENLLSLKQIFIHSAISEPVEYEIVSISARKGFFIIQIKGLTSINDVLPMVGHEVSAKIEDISDLNDGEFYWYELVGAQVKTVNGEIIGKVKSIIPTGANDVLQIKPNNGGGEILIPYIDDIIVEVDLENKVIIINPFEGMLD